MASLYKITPDLIALMDSAFDPETGEMSAEFYEMRGKFEDKALAVSAYILNQAAIVKMMKDHETVIKEKREGEEKRIERLRDYLAANMKAAGITSLKAVDGTYSVSLGIGRDEVVVLDDGLIYPPELCNDPKPPAPSKTKIKAALKAGIEVAGASLVKNDRLTIK